VTDGPDQDGGAGDWGGSLSRGQRALVAVAPATRMMTGILMGTALAVYIGERGTPFAVGMVATAYWLGLMVFAPVWGAIADITGRRRAVLVLTGGVATVAVLPLAVVDGVWVPIGFRALYAAFAAGFAPIMLSIVSAHGGIEARGRSIGFFNSAYAAGFAGGRFGAGVLLGLVLPSSLFLVVAAVSLVSTVAVVFLEDPTPDPGTDPTLEELAGEIRTRLLPAVGDREHLKTHGLRWLYVALALRNMTVLGIGGLLAPYLIGTVGVSAVVMGIVLALNPGSQVISMYLFGRVADAAGRKPLIVVGMAGSAVHALIVAGATVPESLLARTVVAGGGMLLLGVAYSAMTTGALAFIGDVSPPVRVGELLGLRSTATGGGGVSGPAILGGAATYVGYEAAFAAGSVLAVAATALVAVALSESKPGAVTGAAATDD
jgi:MFS family permease